MNSNDDSEEIKGGGKPIEAIRNIIFGEQEKSFTKKFNKLEQSLTRLDGDFSEQLKSIELQLGKLAQSLTDLRNTLQENEARMNKKIEEVRSDLKKSSEKLEKSKLNKISLAEKLENLVLFLRDSK